VEKVVRKLLVTCQKGGVGKTTTSMNLASATAKAGARVLLLDADPLSNISNALNLSQHPQRQTLRKCGVDLPGVLVVDILPGLDVLSPYEDGGCGDHDLDELFGLLQTRAMQQRYGCLIVDTPPFLGANPAQLLSTCDEYLLVIRAEPMAYRTLPAFQEMVRKANTGIQMRGILLTLPESEAPGGHWEREMRGRLGARVLPQVVPYDEEVTRALAIGQLVTQAHPELAVSGQYHLLSQGLGLADFKATGDATTEETFVQAAQQAQQTRVPAVAAVGASGIDLDEAPPFTPAPEEPVLRDEPEPPTLSQLVPLPAALRMARPKAPSRPPATPARPPVTPSQLPPPRPRTPKPAVPAPQGRTPTPTSGLRGAQPWIIWIGVAVLLGFGLRFVRLPEFMLPIAVGLAVTTASVLLLRLLMTLPDSQETTAKKRSAVRPALKSGAAEVKRPSAKETAARLNALARRKPKA
jgi:chromosome partitioning protein